MKTPSSPARHRPYPAWGPGIAAAACATAVAYAVAHWVPALNPSIVAVILGALVTNLRLHAPALHPGTRLAGKRLLRIAVVLLGLQLSLPELARLGGRGLAVVAVTVAATFVGTRLLARALGVPPARGLLVATGFSICGASAVAAMEPVAGGDEDDTAVAVALVTLCGTLAIVVLPALRGPLGLDVADFGSWAGASVHDVGQTVATAQRVPGALTTAVVVKLTRVVLLAPLVASVGLAGRRRRAPSPARAGAMAAPARPAAARTVVARPAAARTATAHPVRTGRPPTPEDTPAPTAPGATPAPTAPSTTSALLAPGDTPVPMPPEATPGPPADAPARPAEGAAAPHTGPDDASVPAAPAAAPEERRLPPPVPLFVAGFLAAIVLTSTGLLPARLLADAKTLQSVLLVAALFGLGTGIHVPNLVRTGGRSLALGLTSWVLVAAVAYAGVRVAAL
ncbi:YeiH family protein [Streptomyces tremellae]|uniref:Sulfate exporter family transporter n=1 Tax=Streptomyces tremellae TaxID=1124239 RepID=A0ABP7F920_9ACTN